MNTGDITEMQALALSAHLTNKEMFGHILFIGSSGANHSLYITFDIQKLILQWVAQYLKEIEQYNILIAAFDIAFIVI